MTDKKRKLDAALRATLRAAIDILAEERQAFVDCETLPLAGGAAGERDMATLTDAVALQAVSEMDAVIAEAEGILSDKLSDSVEHPVGRFKTVPVDDLFTAVRDFDRTVARAVREHRYGAVAEARAAFQMWCVERGLPIDFADPSEEDR